MAGPAVPVVLSVHLPEHPPDRDVLGNRHPSRPQRLRGPARLTITIVEGRGIWVELDGHLTHGSLQHVRARLDRLAELGFGVVVLGAGGVRSIDGDGTRLLESFVDRVCDLRGTVIIVDPDGCVRLAARRLGRATLTTIPPDGTWWLA